MYPIKFIYRALLLLVLPAALACNKSTTHEGAASLTVVNTVAGSQSLVVNFSNEPLHWYKDAYQLYYGNYATANRFNSYSGPQHLQLYPFPDTTAHDVPMFDLSFDLPVGSIRCLFLTGTVVHPDTLFTTDHLAYHPDTDSVASIRFVNLSQGSQPISVNLQGQPNGSEVSSLPYKGITEFMPYTAKLTTGSYTFEIRDAGTGDLITTYTASDVGNPGYSYLPNTWLFRNNTIALIGIPGGTDNMAQASFVINNF